MIVKNKSASSTESKKPKKRLGQNFLKDGNILRYEAKLLNPKDKIVFEIGAGDGRLTRKILDLGPKKVYAVELDKRLVNELKKIDDKRLIIIQGDIKKIKIPDDVELVVGNIPYYLSSSIIFSLPKYNIFKAVLMIQKEFGEKMVAKPNQKNYGRLSVTSQLFFNIKKRKVVPMHLFFPKPKVDSVIIELTPTHVQLSEKDEDIIRRLFSHKNKKIRSTFKDASKEWSDTRPRTMSSKDVLDFINELNRSR